MNPFQLKPEKNFGEFMDWQHIYPRAYDKMEADPYTRVRVILMNGTEFESVKYSHQFQRQESNNDLRRELAMMRRQEQQQPQSKVEIEFLAAVLKEYLVGLCVEFSHTNVN